METRGSARVLLAVALLAVAVACGDGSSPDDEAVEDDGAAAAPELHEGSTWEVPGFRVAADDLACGTAAPDPQRGITPTSVRVGGLASVTGPSAAVYADAEAGARARFARANAEGGVHGRTIDFVGVQDDAMDPARQAQATRQLVDQGVFAVVPLISALSEWRDPLCEAVVPHFGWGITPAWCGTTVGFAITGCLANPDQPVNSIAVGAIIEALPSAGATLAIVGNDDAAAGVGQQRTVEALEHHGVDVVYSENVLDPAVPDGDVSTVVGDILGSDGGQAPDAVYMVADAAGTATLTNALVAADYGGALLNAVAYDPRLAGVPGFEGAMTMLQWAPFEAGHIAFVQRMNEDFAQHAPLTMKGLAAAGGYIAADMFLAALAAAGPDLTVDRFLEVANGNWVYPTPDFRGDARFPVNHVLGVPCSTVVEMREGAYAAASPLVCNEPFSSE